MHKRIFASLLSIAVLSGAGLPEEGPIPEKKPVAAEEKTPVQAEKPKAEKPKEEKPAQPQVGAEEVSPSKEITAPAKAEDPLPELKIESENTEQYATCLAALKEIGAEFKEIDRIDDGKGCGIDKPLTLQTVLPGVALKPEGTMRCETALELARWTKDAVLPAAKAALDSEGPLTTINQASSYICRLRNNAATGKISEHARGNAIDIASFTFKSGKAIEIQPRDEDATLSGAFQRAVTASGCLYFETVLDPGSDEAHENHLHFDVLERKNGYRYCR